jgi:hypothetical protein
MKQIIVSFSEPTESEYEDEDEKRITVFIEQKINY